MFNARPPPTHTPSRPLPLHPSGDTSELGVSYPFGRGFHYRLDPFLTQREAKIAMDELFESPFFNISHSNVRMLHVSAMYSASNFTNVQISVLFSIEITEQGFIFTHWKARAIPTSGLFVVDTCIFMLLGIWGLQGVTELWKIIRLCQAKSFCKM